MSKLMTKFAKSSADKKEPFVRVAKRENTGFLYRTLVRVAATGISLLIILIFLQQVSSISITNLWKYIQQGSFFTEYSKRALVKDAMLLLGVALALAPAFKMRFWNIGAQGQVLMGALLTSVVMWYFADLSNSAMILVMFIFAVLAGGLWAVIPAIFKVKLNANETLFTLMMNYIAVQLVACAIDIWKGKSSALPTFNSATKLGYLPAVGENPFGLVTVLIAIITVLMFVYMRNTKHGYEISVVGDSINTARYAGINTGKVILRTMFLSGAICGLVGFLYVGGVDHVISTKTSGSYGFTAIIVAWAAGFNPFGMAVISFIITFLSKGAGNVVNYASNLNSYTSYIVVGIFLFMLIGCEFFIRYRLAFNSKITASNAAFKKKLAERMPKTNAAVVKFSVWRTVTVTNFIEIYNNAIAKMLDGAMEFFSKAFGGLKNALNKKKSAAATETYKTATLEIEKIVSVAEIGNADGAKVESCDKEIVSEKELNNQNNGEEGKNND